MYDNGLIILENPSLESSCLLTGRNFQNLILWRPRIGEAFTICSTDERFFRARVTRLGSDTAEVFVFEGFNAQLESHLKIMLLQALPQKERMELIIQKTTELGVSSIIPFKSGRSTSIEQRDTRQKKSHKWSEIALKAAKQSRRATIPEIHPCCDFNEAIRMASGSDFKILLWENEKTALLKESIRRLKYSETCSVAVVVGPEGGFEDEEVEEAQKAGFLSVSLGQRILRTETASIVMVGLIQYELGNLG
ncbi:MAG: RsmE family RNA methyltransferase [Deltaproteobacteria bacterium]